MKKAGMKLGGMTVEFELPESCDVLRMSEPEPLGDPGAAIRDGLDHPIKSESLSALAKARLRANPDARAVIVVSDNTRPVPYRGDSGILWPTIQTLLDSGFGASAITVLVATGTHRAMEEHELRAVLDPRVFELGIAVRNHDCHDSAGLVELGRTRRGTRVFINRTYVEADLKVLTGLVESHFMAGASGGRKSVCPGLMGETGTYVFHGAPILASPNARDLVLDGNPCHEEALEVARMAGADFVMNVTLDHAFRITGVFAGELDAAHRAAATRLREYVAIPLEREYDAVVTHAGFVGINHYQAAKAAVAAIPALKPGGKLILAANHTDTDPVGSPVYRSVLHLLKIMGPVAFTRLILSPDWPFAPEQWQVQMWARVFMRIPQDNMFYYSPRLQPRDYAALPGRDGNALLPMENRYGDDPDVISRFVEGALQCALSELNDEGCANPSVAFLADGPYGIPIRE